VIRPLVEFKNAVWKTDDNFVDKVAAENVKLDDILEMMTSNDETCERLKLGI